jgi:hypothetical protein
MNYEVKVNLTIPPESNVLDVLRMISEHLQKLHDEDTTWPAYQSKCHMEFTYNIESGSLEYKCCGEDNLSVEMRFLHDSCAISWLKLMNQPVTKDNIAYLRALNWKFTYENVWNRNTNLYWHATFSNSPHNFIATNLERWPVPNVLYPYNSSDNSFKIWCTVDGKNKITPIHACFIVQLCFIINYGNTMVL